MEAKNFPEGLQNEGLNLGGLTSESGSVSCCSGRPGGRARKRPGLTFAGFSRNRMSGSLEPTSQVAYGWSPICPHQSSGEPGGNVASDMAANL